MESIKLLARNGEAVRQALELGEILHLETASEELTDEFLLFAMKSGLLEQWAQAFPDPRQWSEISMQVIIAASLAARFRRTLLFAQDRLCLALGARPWRVGLCR